MPKVLRPDAALTTHSLLRLMWLASPALPVGGFSYSEGLETAVDEGRVRNEDDAATWLVDQLRLSQARSELVVCAQVLRAWARRDAVRVTALNDWVRQTRESAELLQQTSQMGRSLTDWLRGRDEPALSALLATLQPAPTWPVAIALAAAASGAPLRESLTTIAFGWAENMVQAAIKTVPLGQSAGQRILARLVDAVPGAVDAALRATDADRQAHTPMLAILSARHEAQYSRLFRS